MTNRSRAHIGYAHKNEWGPPGSDVVAHPLWHLRPWARARVLG